MEWRERYAGNSRTISYGNTCGKKVPNNERIVSDFKLYAKPSVSAWIGVVRAAKCMKKSFWIDQRVFEAGLVKPISTIDRDVGWYTLPVIDWQDWIPWTKKTRVGLRVKYVCCNKESPEWSSVRKMTVIGTELWIDKGTLDKKWVTIVVK